VASNKHKRAGLFTHGEIADLNMQSTASCTLATQPKRGVGDMPKRTPQDWETLEGELHTAGVSQAEIEAGARRLLAEARGHQLGEVREQLGRTQRDISTAMGVSIARVSQIEHGEVTSF